MKINKMKIFKDEPKKKIFCCLCGPAMSSSDLKDGNCSNCDTDEDIYINDLTDEEE